MFPSYYIIESESLDMTGKFLSASITPLTAMNYGFHSATANTSSASPFRL